ncbi:uncharacterized protein LOC18424379 isoform X1 [Amborella trichopoda]|nr:uncharacterized protein LOC18424379 isoform X1 [Amborella trichopoda]|eukprot:XP_006829030.2 uncharacterized protein LOC18424379 isoform X1 [Amborella trichopoda]
MCRFACLPMGYFSNSVQFSCAPLQQAEDLSLSFSLSLPAEKAMSIMDDLSEGIEALSFTSEEPNHRNDQITPEDAAWVDSCLIKELGSHPMSMNGTLDALNEMFSNILNPDTVSDYIASFPYFDNSGKIEEESTSVVHSFPQNLSPSSENMEEFGDLGLETMAGVEDGESLEDIFKVWDLNTEWEDDDVELLKQLTEALVVSKRHSPPVLNRRLDSGETEGLKDMEQSFLDEERINALTAGLKNLSLTQFSFDDLK